MKKYVIDTHALFWYLTGSPRLGQLAFQAFEEAKTGKAIIYIPAIVLAELYFLNIKAGFVVDFVATYRKLQAGKQFVFISFEPVHVLDFEPDQSVSEIHDRIIVGVARRLEAVCLSRDQNIIASGLVRTAWD